MTHFQNPVNARTLILTPSISIPQQLPNPAITSCRALRIDVAACKSSKYLRFCNFLCNFYQSTSRSYLNANTATLSLRGCRTFGAKWGCKRHPLLSWGVLGYLNLMRHITFIGHVCKSFVQGRGVSNPNFISVSVLFLNNKSSKWLPLNKNMLQSS